MTSKSIARDILTLPLAMLAGAAVAALFRVGGVEFSTGSDSADLSSSAGRSSAAPAIHPSAARRSPQASVYAAAWESLKDGRLTSDDRLRAQKAILAEWVRHDLAAALEAVYADRPAFSHLRDPLRWFDLESAMTANPEIVEELLKSGRLGLDTNEFRADWFRILAVEDPVAVLGRIGELSGEHRFSVLSFAAGYLPSISQDPAMWQAAMERISLIISGDGKKDGVAEVIGMRLGQANSLQDLSAAYLADADPQMQELFVHAAYFASLPSDLHLGMLEMRDEVQSLPEPFRSAVIGRWKAETRGTGELLPSPPE
jgi:hypothetical protein